MFIVDDYERFIRNLNSLIGNKGGIIHYQKCILDKSIKTS